MDEKLKKREIAKLKYVLDAAQHELDSAKDSKAPQSTIKHLEQRVEALQNKINKWEKKPDAEEIVEGIGEHGKASTTEANSGKTKGKKDKR